MLSNCILWAYAMKRRRRRKGKLNGRVYFRWSDWGPFLHFLYTEKINGRWRIVSYKPLNPLHQFLPPPLFRGAPRWGDD